MSQDSNPAKMQSSACVLCAINCGLKIQVKDGHFTRIHGDKNHPQSQGYLCEKALALDRYPHHARRLTQPMRKGPEGRF